MDDKRKYQPDPKRAPKETTPNNYRPITCQENINGPNLPGRCAIIITICYSDNTIQSHTLRNAQTNTSFINRCKNNQISYVHGRHQIVGQK